MSTTAGEVATAIRPFQVEFPEALDVFLREFAKRPDWQTPAQT